MVKKATIFLLIFLAVLTYSLPMIGSWLGLGSSFAPTMNKITASLLVIILALGLLTALEGWITVSLNIPDDERRYIGSILKYVTGGLALLVTVFIFVADLTSLTLLGGLIGAGVAVALQQPLTAIFGWVYIITARAYKIGDRIFIGDSSFAVYGDVVDINLFFTKISEVGEKSWQETGGVVSVPNNYMTQKILINYTGESPFVWDDVKIPVKYGSDYKAAMSLAEQAASEVAGEKMKDAAHFLGMRKLKLKIRDTENVPRAYISLRDKDALIVVRYLVAARKRRKVNSQISQLVAELFKKNKIQLAG